MSNIIFKKEILFLIPLFFLPQSNFGIYFSIMMPILSIIIILNKTFIIKQNYFYLIILMFGLLTAYLFIKFLLFKNLYDFKELLKIILFIMVYFASKKVTLKDLETFLFIYIIIDVSISLLQFVHYESFFLKYISIYYSAEIHAETALKYISVRALGLSAGPGPHGVTSLLIFWFFITLAIFDKKNMYRVLGLIAAFSSLIMSQSKSCILSLFVSFIIFIIFILLYKNKVYKFIISVFLIFLIFLIFYFIEDIENIFYAFKRLSEMGIQTSSMDARLRIWNEMYQAILLASPMLFLFGAGRSYLTYVNVHNKFFDSDYVYIFVNYGFIVFCIFVFFILLYLINGFFQFNKNTLLNKILYMIILSGSISSLAIGFFIDLKIISILGIIFAIRTNEIYNTPREKTIINMIK